MHLKVTENGHIILINRMNDVMYFFYQCKDKNNKLSEEYKVHKIAFMDKFNIE